MSTAAFYAGLNTPTKGRSIEHVKYYILFWRNDHEQGLFRTLLDNEPGLPRTIKSSQMAEICCMLRRELRLLTFSTDMLSGWTETGFESTSTEDESRGGFDSGLVVGFVAPPPNEA